MISLLSIVYTRPQSWRGCRQLTASERMARYSARHAADMQLRENLGAGTPHVRVIDGRPVLLALPGSVNQLPATAAQADEGQS